MATTPPSPGDPLNDDEIRELAVLLARYATHELDQFDRWRVETPSGPVFIEVSTELQSDASASSYRTIWPLPPHLQHGRRSPWVVWRQDDNGNRYEVARLDSRADAEALAATMEARGHKQTYWVAAG
jgi:hypothetical protein